MTKEQRKRLEMAARGSGVIVNCDDITALLTALDEAQRDAERNRVDAEKWRNKNAN